MGGEPEARLGRHLGGSDRLHRRRFKLAILSKNLTRPAKSYSAQVDVVSCALGSMNDIQFKA